MRTSAPLARYQFPDAEELLNYKYYVLCAGCNGTTS